MRVELEDIKRMVSYKVDHHIKVLRYQTWHTTESQHYLMEIGCDTNTSTIIKYEQPIGNKDLNKMEQYFFEEVISFLMYYGIKDIYNTTAVLI